MFHYLPDEIKLNINKFLDDKTLLNERETNKLYEGLAGEELLNRASKLSQKYLKIRLKDALKDPTDTSLSEKKLIGTITSFESDLENKFLALSILAKRKNISSTVEDSIFNALVYSKELEHHTSPTYEIFNAIKPLLTNEQLQSLLNNEGANYTPLNVAHLCADELTPDRITAILNMTTYQEARIKLLGVIAAKLNKEQSEEVFSICESLIKEKISHYSIYFSNFSILLTALETLQSLKKYHANTLHDHFVKLESDLVLINKQLINNLPNGKDDVALGFSKLYPLLTQEQKELILKSTIDDLSSQHQPTRVRSIFALNRMLPFFTLKQLQEAIANALFQGVQQKDILISLQKQINACGSHKDFKDYLTVAETLSDYQSPRSLNDLLKLLDNFQSLQPDSAEVKEILSHLDYSGRNAWKFSGMVEAYFSMIKLLTPKQIETLLTELLTNYYESHDENNQKLSKQISFIIPHVPDETISNLVKDAIEQISSNFSKALNILFLIGESIPADNCLPILTALQTRTHVNQSLLALPICKDVISLLINKMSDTQINEHKQFLLSCLTLNSMISLVLNQKLFLSDLNENPFNYHFIKWFRSMYSQILEVYRPKLLSSLSFYHQPKPDLVVRNEVLPTTQPKI